MVNVEEVKDLIRDYFMEYVERDQHNVDVHTANAELIKRLDDLDKHMWNPVEDPVPSDDRYVLLSFENFRLPMIGRYEQDKNGCGNFYLGDCDGQDTCLANNLYVNAWMELPEPYKG